VPATIEVVEHGTAASNARRDAPTDPPDLLSHGSPERDLHVDLKMPQPDELSDL
jgi:hypothetical protein